MRKFSILLILLGFLVLTKADEGMWMLPLMEELNRESMQQMGCELSSDAIYSNDHVSLKDAVVIFGGGCTGVVVSNQGLIFTNHHCGYGSIQKLSTVEHNYLKAGFTAANLSDELPVPGLTVTFLISTTNVTERVRQVMSDSLDYAAFKVKRDSVMAEIEKEYAAGNDYLIEVKSFYADNEFYVFVMEEFEDIRLAYTPPTSIGKFGGDTDNWMWPRHTGDFSVFRIYADPEGKPAPFSEANIPYEPRTHVGVSTKGYDAGDFAMILGHPGSTSRYLTSWGIHNRMYAVNQARIDVRGVKQSVWKSYMQEDEAINIAYAGKYAGSSNYWKNSIGMNQAITKLKVIDRKKDWEIKFENWVEQDPHRKKVYGNVLSQLEKHYVDIFPALHATSYLKESLVNGVEMPRIASKLEQLMQRDVSPDSVAERAAELYKDFVEQVDMHTMGAMLETYRKYVDESYLPPFYSLIDKKFKGDYSRYAERVFNRSAFANQEKFMRLFAKGKVKLPKDPALKFAQEVDNMLASIDNDAYRHNRDQIEEAVHLFEAGLKAIYEEEGKPLYPDANFTMRLSYGEVGGYDPFDAVTYHDYTTSQGILEKEIPGDMEFHVSPALKTMLLERDFGPYADAETGELVVNFLTNNDITGGNSGSPVFNGCGELIGLAFDGNWEAMSGDIVFEPTLQRTINVDVRYILFVMEKQGHANRLINELDIR